ncbi:hypothetical protein GCM10027064_01540 [Microbacterium petrolearium]
MSDDGQTFDPQTLEPRSLDPRGAPGPEEARGGAEGPTGSDGQLGADAPSGDAGLAGAHEVGEGAMPGGADSPSDVYGDDGLYDDGLGPEAPDEEEGQL